jgi:hypothetical protein
MFLSGLSTVQYLIEHLLVTEPRPILEHRAEVGSHETVSVIDIEHSKGLPAMMRGQAGEHLSA